MSEEDMAKRFMAPLGPTVMPDLSGAYKEGGILSPVDGSFITSRAQLRRHNATHQCRQAGEIRPGTLQAQENRRVERIREIAKGGEFRWE
jgi:hypothetical protein